MMKKTLITLLLIIALIIVSNTSLGVFIGRPVIQNYYYESLDRKFSDVEQPAKGRRLEIVEEHFEEYKKWSGNSNAQLYRTTKRNLLKFYEWLDYLTNPRWEYPYIVPSKNPNELGEINAR